MDRAGKIPLFLIDAIGGAVVVACLATSFWLTATRVGGGERPTAEPKRLIETARHDLASLVATRDRQQVLYDIRKEKLAESGQLPEQTPVEEYFQTLSRLAARNRLRVVSNSPLSPCKYPGLLEQRFAYEVTGSVPDLVHFFQAVETTDFWADISYMEVKSGLGASGQLHDGRVARLTLSLFSALPQIGDVDDG